jgi:hypothetical protein
MLRRACCLITLCCTSCATVPKLVHLNTKELNGGNDNGPVRTTYRCYPLLPNGPIEGPTKKFSIVWVCDLESITVTRNKWGI